MRLDMEISGRHCTGHDAAPQRAREGGPRCLENALERRHPWRCHGVGRISYGAVVHGFRLAFGRFAMLLQQNVRLKVGGRPSPARNLLSLPSLHERRASIRSSSDPVVGILGPFSKVPQAGLQLVKILVQLL
ncbi:MAG TPA: hypothetical protein VGG10_07810 [Rhizomicrobium sp.]|jgi:hypothetical protein